MIDSSPSERSEHDLPPALVLQKIAQQKLRESQQAVSDYAQLHYPLETEDYTEEQLSEWQETILPEFTDAILPAKIAGSDSIRLYNLSGPDLATGDIKEGFFAVICNLYEDGSPYIPEEFIDVAGDQKSFYIYFGVEFPPFMAAGEEIESTEPKPDYPIRNGILYLDTLRERGREPRYLTDDECIQLADVLAVAAIDLSATCESELRSLQSLPKAK